MSTGKMKLLRRHRKFAYLIIFVYFYHSILAVFPPLQGDEASFWEWSRHLAFGYYAHPPMTAWLIALVTNIFTTTQYTIRLTSILLHIISLFAVYQIALDISKKTTVSFVATIICSLMPLSLVFGTGITTDSSLICFYTLSVLYVRRAVIDNNKAAWYLAALTCGGMLLSKFMAILFFPGLFLFLVFNPKYRSLLFIKEPYLAFLIAWLIFSPFLIWNYQNEWLTFQFNFIVRHQNSGFDLLKPLIFLGAQLLAVSPVLWIILLLALFRFLNPFQKKVKDTSCPTADSIKMVSYVVAFPLLCFLLLSFNIRIGAHWLAAVYPASSVLITAWFYSRQKFVQFERMIRRLEFKLALVTSVVLILGITAPMMKPSFFFPDRMLYTQQVGGDQPILSHYYGWRAVGEKIRQLEKEWASKPEGFFFTSKDYSIASMLGFYTPGHPQFYLMNFPKDGIHGKDILIWQKGKKKIGANTIYVTDTYNSYHDRLDGFFKKTVELPPFIIRDDKGRILRIFYFTAGIHYLGGEPDHLSVL